MLAELDVAEADVQETAWLQDSVTAAWKPFADVDADPVHVPEAASSVKRPASSAGSLVVLGHSAAYWLIETMFGVLGRHWHAALDGPSDSLYFADALRSVTTKVVGGFAI